jgi:hypothetical protein
MMFVLNHIPHTEKQTTKPIVASHATNIIPKVNCKFIEPQNGPTPHEHTIQGLHNTMGVVLLVLAHMSIVIINNYLPIGIVSPCGQLDPTF